MITEIINIGDELLNGTSTNSNATWLSGRLVRYGSTVKAVTMIGDDLDIIIEALQSAGSRAELVVVTGGLGPTSDDKTKEATIRFFGGKLIPDEKEIERIRNLFAERGLELTERNIQQGWVPDKAIIRSNPAGTAPGMEFIHAGVRFVFLPGVPVEMQRIVDDNIAHWFQSSNSAKTFVYDEMMVIGIGESFVADKLSAWQEQLPDWISLAFLPSAGLVKIRLSCYHQNPEQAMAAFREYLLSAIEIFPEDSFYTRGLDWNSYFNISLAEKHLSIATAESCTGGYLAHRITTVPGSSQIFRGSIVAYHNDIKTGWLNVPEETIEAHGAVSAEVVGIMAGSIRSRFNTDIGVAVSGIAGPEGGTDNKPVGTVWISVADSKRVQTKMFLMGTDRIRNIEKSSVMAMKMVLNLIQVR